jgi:N-acetylneuraminic acid mutarotase
MKKRVGVAALILAALVVLTLAGCGLLSPPSTTLSTSTTIITTTTTTEPPASWNQAEPTGTVPSARCYAAMVYDPTSRRVLMFAGFDGTNALGETWAYEAAGNSWVNLSPVSKDQPSAAVQVPAVFDPPTSKVITFNGTTWGYDVTANTWKALSPKGKLKPARMGASMVLDAASGKVILFGGTDMHTWYDETWSYDPSANTWINLKPAGVVPTGRSDAGMAYDPTSGKIILFGGVDGDFNCLDDTWSYDAVANTWTKLTATGTAPSARSGLGIAYDPHSMKIILFGGIDSQFVCYNDTWAYDPAAGTWTQLTPVGNSPMARGRSSLVYDAAIDKMVLFGGATVQADSTGGFGTQVYLNDTWIYGVNLDTDGSGTASTQVAPLTSTTLPALGSGGTTTTLP